MPAPKIDDKKFAAHMARNKKPKKMTSTQKSLADISKRANENYDKEPPSPDEKSMAMRQAKFIGYVAEEIMEHVEGDNDFPEWMQNKLSEFHQKAKDMHSTMAGEYEDDEEEMDENYKSEYQRHSQGLKDAKADMKAAKTNSDMVKAMNKKAHHSKALSKMNRMESVNEMGPRHTSKPMKSRFGGAVDSKKFDTYKKFVKQRNVDEPTVRMVIDNPNDAESKRMMKNANIAKAVELRKAAMKESISEKLSVSDGMGAWIDDFKKSDAPQFKGKNEKSRKDMAIAAYLSAKRKAKKEDTSRSADVKPQNVTGSDGKMHVRMVHTKLAQKDKQEGYVSMAQQRAVWATRKDGGKGHPDNKKGKKK